MDNIINREELEGAIYQYLLKNQDKTGYFSLWSSEDYEDFLSTFYPRLKKSIKHYRDIGASFESYLGAIMHTSAKEYHLRKVVNSMTEYSAWSIQVPDLYVMEENPGYLHEIKESSLSKILKKDMKVRNPKQLLSLVLKCYYFVSDDFIDRFADYSGIGREKLKEMIDRLRKLRKEKEDKLYKMKESVYSQFYRCIVYEKRLEVTQENTTAYEIIKLKAEKAREKLEKMRSRILKIKSGPNNREIAEVIGVSKGAVDSNLSVLRKRWIKKKSVSDS
jgi:DNA-directed RNA polymerase specialized sigma24 family protein